MSNFIIDPIKNKQLSLFSYEGKHLLKSYITYYNKVIQSGGAGAGGGCKCGDSGCSDCTNQRRGPDRKRKQSGEAAAGDGETGGERERPRPESESGGDGGGARSNDGGGLAYIDWSWEAAAERDRFAAAEQRRQEEEAAQRAADKAENLKSFMIAYGEHRPGVYENVANMLGLETHVPPTDPNRKSLYIVTGSGTGLVSNLEYNNSDTVYDIILKARHNVGTSVGNGQNKQILKLLATDNNTLIHTYKGENPEMIFTAVLDPDLPETLAGMRRDGYALFDASEALRGDKGVVLAAVQQNGWALEYASDELKNDIGVVLAAVQQNGDALYFASEALRGEKEVVLAAVQKKGNALEYASENFKREKEVVLAAVENDGYALRHASEALRGDSSVVLAAVQQNGNALMYASDALKKDPKLIRIKRKKMF